MGKGVISTLSTGKNYTCTGDNDGLIRVWPSYGNENFKNNFEAYHERRMSLMALAQSEDELEEKNTSAKEEKKVRRNQLSNRDKKTRLSLMSKFQKEPLQAKHYN